MIEVKYDNNSTKDRKGKWKSNVRFLLYMQNGILSVNCDKVKMPIFNPRTTYKKGKKEVQLKKAN